MARNERSLYLVQHTGELIRAVVARNPGRAADEMDVIAGKYGGEGILHVCRTASELARRRAFPGIERGDGSLSGDMMTILQKPGAEPDPNTLWAAQFFTAHANGDDDTLGALFLTGFKQDPQGHATRVVTLLRMCGTVLRGGR